MIRRTFTFTLTECVDHIERKAWLECSSMLTDHGGPEGNITQGLRGPEALSQAATVIARSMEAATPPPPSAANEESPLIFPFPKKGEPN